MENKEEDEIRKKWEQEARDRAAREEEAAQRSKKRPRTIGYQKSANDLGLESMLADRSRGATKSKRGSTKPLRAAETRAKSRITELTEEEEEIVELD